MLNFIKSKKDCTGCGACLNACPVDGITMHADQEGFLYPEKNENCIDCEQCENACPLASGDTHWNHKFVQHAFAAVSKDKKVWQASTSGGAFTEICKAFGDDNTAIFGAAFDGLQVRHCNVFGCGQIEPFRKSKYVQSDIGLCYRDVRALLEENNTVIFSGAPCQVAGLRKYLVHDYDNLLCVDFICHGVGSPAVFQAFLLYLEAKYGAKVRAYTFRVKNVFLGNYSLYVSRYIFENSKTIFVENDEYNNFFLQQLCLRPSCGEHCRFRTTERLSDLTIADFKKREIIFPLMSDYRNYSAIIVNSRKGDEVLVRLYKNMNILSCDLDHVKKYNPLFYTTTKGNPLREAFFNDFTNGMNFKDLVQIYTTLPAKIKRADQIKKMIPYNIKYWMRRIRIKLKGTRQKS